LSTRLIKLFNRIEHSAAKAATKDSNISRKDAKHVLRKVEGAAKKIVYPNLALFAPWREESPSPTAEDSEKETSK
jgi:hypothetical protein